MVGETPPFASTGEEDAFVLLSLAGTSKVTKLEPIELECDNELPPSSELSECTDLLSLIASIGSSVSKSYSLLGTMTTWFMLLILLMKRDMFGKMLSCEKTFDCSYSEVDEILRLITFSISPLNDGQFGKLPFDLAAPERLGDELTLVKLAELLVIVNDDDSAKTDEEKKRRLASGFIAHLFRADQITCFRPNSKVK
jgi:hypothetical protein